MPRPEGLTDEQWDQLLQERIAERWRNEQRERIIREGFEIMAWDGDEETKCEYQKVVQVSPRKRVTQPCGKPVLVVLDFRGPQHPDGLKVNFCRECLAEHVRDIMRFLT